MFEQTLAQNLKLGACCLGRWMRSILLLKAIKAVALLVVIASLYGHYSGSFGQPPCDDIVVMKPIQWMSSLTSELYLLFVIVYLRGQTGTQSISRLNHQKLTALAESRRTPLQMIEG